MFAYRDEIDGLRSIAVIPVIFYHAGLSKYFSGGYVGVDIFFVISGYLITSVIDNECQAETFSLIISTNDDVVEFFQHYFSYYF
jgi:peptidoglycan/LPS O-acetylase OafA/YrhL